MHGTVLVIDPIATNRIVLRVKLSASQYDVLQAASIDEAMRHINLGKPDLILTSLALPDGAPRQLVNQLRVAGLWNKVPLIALGGDGDSAERMKLLALGFDDVLPRPLDIGFLMARARSLLRGYASASEWMLREGTTRALGFSEPKARFGPKANIQIVSAGEENYAHWCAHLETALCANVAMAGRPYADGAVSGGGATDAFVLVARSEQCDETLGYLASLRCHADTRHAVVLMVEEGGATPRAAQMLDTGANDVVPHNATLDEVALRLDVLLKRKRMTDALRDTVRNGAESAVIDPLTGLHNRRYAMPHVERIAERAALSGKPFALMIADMDHFKRINDNYGHAAGDAVLIEVAKRLRGDLRALDLVARIGGEEFLIVMPGIGLENAQRAAQRLCHKMGTRPFHVPQLDLNLRATMSIGMIVCDTDTDTAKLSAEALLARADRALYDAKAEGRNRVTLCSAAA